MRPKSSSPNPSVANAVVRSSRRLYVIAMAGGQTTIFAMDAQGRQIATIEISVGQRHRRDSTAFSRRRCPAPNIVLRTVNDTIILTGEVDSAGEAQKALDIANGFVSQANASRGGRRSRSGRRRPATNVSVGASATSAGRQGHQLAGDPRQGSGDAQSDRRRSLSPGAEATGHHELDRERELGHVHTAEWSAAQPADAHHRRRDIRQRIAVGDPDRLRARRCRPRARRTDRHRRLGRKREIHRRRPNPDSAERDLPAARNRRRLHDPASSI